MHPLAPQSVQSMTTRCGTRAPARLTSVIGCCKSKVWHSRNISCLRAAMRKLSLPAQVCWPNKHNAANECMHLQAADPSVTTVHHCFRRTPLLTLAVRQPVTDTATPDGSFLLRASSSVVGNCFTMMIKLASAQAPVMSYRIEKVFFRMRARVCVYAYVCVCVG